MTTDQQYMQRCIQLALHGRYTAKPNPMVGAVLVYQDRIIGEGWHYQQGLPHAEVNAFASVAAQDSRLVPQATLYVSLEPCAHYGKTPPCAKLIIEKGVKRVVVGCVDPYAQVQGKGITMLKNAGVNVVVGVLEEACKNLNRRFFATCRLQRPYIILKWAQTQDGLIDQQGVALAISSPYTKMLVHQLRAESDVIVVGNTTEQREHPQLNVRHWSGKQPRKYVLRSEDKIEELLQQWHQEGVQTVLVEGGKITLDAFIRQNLYDEIRVETAPIVVHRGTQAPSLPQDICLLESQCWDNRTIHTYYRVENAGM